MDSMRGNVDERLDALLQAYREACPTPEPSANFMPNLWRRIESRQNFTFSFQRMANAFVTAAVALTIALGVYMSIPRSNSSYSQTYLEALADANALDTPDYVAPVHLDLSDPGR
jgi:ABC-type nitrate/sulfonate/bicarbonate transport system permease component